jgi:hypothetical protein
MSNESPYESGSTPTPYPEITAKPLEVTPELIASHLTIGGSRVMKWPPSAIEQFAAGQIDIHRWMPTTISVSRITLMVDPAPGAEPPQTVWSRVTIFGTGWDRNRPVALKWNNAWGFPGTSIPLPDAAPGPGGIFSMEVVHKTVHRRHSEFYWDHNLQLVLVARQTHPNGAPLLDAHQRGIPPHVIWQWVP